MRTLILLVLVLFAASASAEVYRWVDSQGVVHYTDKPPNKTARPVELPPLQTFKPAPLPDDALSNLSTPEQDKAKRPEPPKPVIVAPRDKATIRDAQRLVSVQVNAALAPGDGLLYYVDGKAQNDRPTRSTHYQLHGIERGTHRLVVALVDADGKTIEMSAPVTIYMKPPTVNHPHGP